MGENDQNGRIWGDPSFQPGEKMTKPMKTAGKAEDNDSQSPSVFELVVFLQSWQESSLRSQDEYFS